MLLLLSHSLLPSFVDIADFLTLLFSLLCCRDDSHPVVFVAVLP
jgi:hypothetical protein